MSAELSLDQTPASFSPDRVRVLIDRITANDESCLPELRQYLDQPRVAAQAWDLAAIVRRQLLKACLPKTLYYRERAARQMEELEVGLLGPSTTEIERLLVQRVVIGWLQVQEADLRLTATPPATSGMALKRAESANRRYLAALKALATIRKFARPTVQVNIGEQQVNVGG